MNRFRRFGMMFGVAVLAFTATVAVSAQDDYRSEVRSVSGFTGVHIGGAMEAEITVGGSYQVTVEAKAKFLPKIITEVRNNTLYVKQDRNWMDKIGWKNRGKVKITVSLPSLENLDISGASEVSVSGINSDKVSIDVSGASAVSVGGNTRTAMIDISGASNIKAEGFYADSADIDASGASSIKLNVATQLRVDASGASSVCYSGNPKVMKDTSGSSSVKACGEVAL